MARNIRAGVFAGRGVTDGRRVGQGIYNMGVDVRQLGGGAMISYPTGFVPSYVMDHHKPCDNCFGEGRYEIDTGKRVICEICNGQGDVRTDPPDDED
jgi:hypothetical protein